MHSTKKMKVKASKLQWKNYKAGRVLKDLLNPTLFVATEKVLRLSILQSTAGNYIDAYQYHHCHYENYVHFPPFTPQVPQQTSSARFAVIAELGLVIAPQIAVRVPSWVRRVRPHSWVHKIVATGCRRLTTSWLPNRTLN